MNVLSVKFKMALNVFFITFLYGSPSQSIEQFSLFEQRWEEAIINSNDCFPTIVMYFGNFNPRNSEWWNGSGVEWWQGTELGELAVQFDLNQVIYWPTDILLSSASCIDLIFTMKSNYVTNSCSCSCVLPLVFPRCHHQLIFAKVSFITFFARAYKQRIWDFSSVNINAIRQAVNCVDWHRAFNSLNIDERVKFLTEYILNVFHNFVPNSHHNQE